MVANGDVMGAKLCVLPVIAAISCSLSQEHMAATRRYIAKTVRAAITSVCLKGILYNRRASWSTPCKRGEAPRTCFAFDIYQEADYYDFINILRTHLICHLEPLQQGYKLLLEVRLL